MIETREQFRDLLDRIHGEAPLLIDASSSIVKFRNFLRDQSMPETERIEFLKQLAAEAETIEALSKTQYFSGLPICETEPGPNGENPVQLDLETIITLAHGEILLALKELESDDPAS